MITTDSIRTLLANADAGKNPYAVAGAAATLLAADPNDSAALGHAVRALLALKLTAAAGRLLQGANLPAEAGAIAGSNPPAASGGVIPWSSRARRFAANLRALESRDPAAAARLRAAADAPASLAAYELHQAADGNFQILDTRAGPMQGWLGGLANHRAATRLWQFDKTKTPLPAPIAFDGLGFGWLFLHLLETTANSFLQYSCAVYVVESDPVALAMLFHMHDMQSILAQPRVRWFFARGAGEAGDGSDALAEFRQAIDANDGFTIPGQFVRCAMRPRPPVDLENAISALSAARQKKRAAQSAQIGDYYTGKTAAHWHRRFAAALAGNDAPLRVLGITSRYTTVLRHSMNELRAAVESPRAGHAGENRTQMRIAIEPDDQSLENPFLREIADFKPDLIVQISRLRYENPAVPREVPFLSWDQDNLPCMRTEQAGDSLRDTLTGPLTYVAGNGAIFGYGHLDWPEQNCIFCHAAGATHRYSAEPAAASLLQTYACDISYVSNAAESPEQLAAHLRSRWINEPAIVGTFDASAADIFATSAAGACWDDQALGQLLTRRAAGTGLESGSPLFHELAMDLHRYADRCFRHATLAWVSRWCRDRGKTLRLYGRGWENHADFKPWAAGVAEPGEMLRAIYQASRINLQMIESGFIHSRSLDGLAAGGFFITRHVPADGEDVAAMRDIHELGRWAVEARITTASKMQNHADPHIRERWRRTLAYHPWTPDQAMRVLKVWAYTPAPAVAFPMLPRISFRSESEFAALADTFLGSGPEDSAAANLRQRLAAEMRKIVLDDFSYDSRWKQFLTRIAGGLSRAAQEP